MSEDGDKAILDKQEGKVYKFKAVAKFTPDSEQGRIPRWENKKVYMGTCANHDERPSQGKGRIFFYGNLLSQ